MLYTVSDQQQQDFTDARFAELYLTVSAFREAINILRVDGPGSMPMAVRLHAQFNRVYESSPTVRQCADGVPCSSSAPPPPPPPVEQQQGGAWPGMRGRAGRRQLVERRFATDRRAFDNSVEIKTLTLVHGETFMSPNELMEIKREAVREAIPLHQKVYMVLYLDMEREGTIKEVAFMSEAAPYDHAAQFDPLYDGMCQAIDKEYEDFQINGSGWSL